MTDPFKPRLFADDAAIRALGIGLLACDLPREAWTHEAHLAACVWLLRERPDIEPEQDLPAIIRAFNESVGGVNDDRQGYHETITQLYIAGVRAHLAERAADEPLVASANALISGPRGRRGLAAGILFARPAFFRRGTAGVCCARPDAIAVTAEPRWTPGGRPAFAYPFAPPI